MTYSEYSYKDVKLSIVREVLGTGRTNHEKLRKLCKIRVPMETKLLQLLDLLDDFSLKPVNTRTFKGTDDKYYVEYLCWGVHLDPIPCTTPIPYYYLNDGELMQYETEK